MIYYLYAISNALEKKRITQSRQSNLILKYPKMRRKLMPAAINVLVLRCDCSFFSVTFIDRI